MEIPKASLKTNTGEVIALKISVDNKMTLGQKVKCLQEVVNTKLTQLIAAEKVDSSLKHFLDDEEDSESDENEDPDAKKLKL